MSPRRSSRKSKSVKKRSGHRGRKSTSRYRASQTQQEREAEANRVNQYLLDLLDRNNEYEDENPHRADGETVYEIPFNAILGRGGVPGTIQGTFNAETGRMHFQNEKFWFEVDMNKIPFFRYAPGGDGYEAAASNFEHTRYQTAL